MRKQILVAGALTLVGALVVGLLARPDPRPKPSATRLTVLPAQLEPAAWSDPGSPAPDLTDAPQSPGHSGGAGPSSATGSRSRTAGSAAAQPGPGGSTAPGRSTPTAATGPPASAPRPDAGMAGPADHGLVVGTRLGTSLLQVGVTHTQYSVDTWGDPQAVASARGLLADAPLSQNQHIMGWGTLNPEPSPGVHDWRTLDARVALMTATTSTPTITLAGAPDWMKGGRPGETDWSKIEVAPLRAHYADFARLSAAVAQRYPTVRRFQVWNELKGFHDPKTNRWDAAAYTDLYNLVYAAVKAVRPDAIIGGPYVVMDSWSSRSFSHPSALQGPWGVADQRPLDVLEHWFRHAVGADFIAVDGSTRTRDKGLITDPFTAVQKYVDIQRWIRARSSLPVVWSEWGPASDIASIDKQAAVAAHALGQVATAGVSSVLIWGPQGPAGCSACMWTDTRAAGGGKATPLHAAVAGFARHFGPGTPLLDLTSPAAGVQGLASDRTIMLVNHTGTEVALPAQPTLAPLRPYEVRFIAR